MILLTTLPIKHFFREKLFWFELLVGEGWGVIFVFEAKITTLVFTSLYS